MMNWKGFGRKRLWPYFKVLPRHSPGGTEKTHEKPQLGQPVAGTRIGPGTSQIRSRNVKKWREMLESAALSLIFKGKVQFVSYLAMLNQLHLLLRAD
jgi:hypothetical protein